MKKAPYLLLLSLSSVPTLSLWEMAHDKCSIVYRAVKPQNNKTKVINLKTKVR